MAKTRDDEIYEKGVRDGQNGGFFDDLIQGNVPGSGREGEIYDKGYKEGAKDRHDPGRRWSRS